jgi:HEAT repeat protein
MGSGELARHIKQLTSGNDTAAEAAVKQLASHGKKAIPALAAVFKGGDADARWWALRALAEIKAPGAAEILIEGLADMEASVRYCAGLALRENPHTAAIPALAALLGDEDRMLAQLAGDALAAVGAEATEALLEVVESGAQAARIAAVRALAGIGDLRSVSTLFRLLDEDSVLLEYWANQGLERMGIGMTFFGVGK